MNLSKSKYTKLWQCPKMLWLSKYKPEEAAPVDESIQARFDDGNKVGDLAMRLFGDYVEMTAFKEGDSRSLDLSEMVKRTREEMSNDTPTICEAAFSHKGLYCAVDILRKEDGGWAIYEVKSSTHVAPVYVADVAYQKYVLEKCGVNVTGTYIVHINNQYVLNGALDIQDFFYIEDIGELIEDELAKIEPNIEEAGVIMKSKNEPDINVGVHCMEPYECAFWNYCASDLPEPSVFDLYRIGFAKALDYYKDDKADYKSLYESGEINNKTQLMQMEHELTEQPAYVDQAGIRSFLDSLHYPLYFLDFETIQPVIPVFDETRPYQQIPFQYSLHYIEEDGGELNHKEFLAESGVDPRRGIAEALCRDIPEGACVMAYNKGFECGRIKELAEAFPDFADKLLSIEASIVDLLVPFQKGYYYNRDMGGSFSIKSVLPAVFPDDPELDYHNLEGVHNGGEAMTLFPKIQFMAPEEAAKAREYLLKYCELDTYAMVKLWRELVRATS